MFFEPSSLNEPGPVSNCGQVPARFVDNVARREYAYDPRSGQWMTRELVVNDDYDEDEDDACPMCGKKSGPCECDHGTMTGNALASDDTLEQLVWDWSRIAQEQREAEGGARRAGSAPAPTRNYAPSTPDEDVLPAAEFDWQEIAASQRSLVANRRRPF